MKDDYFQVRCTSELKNLIRRRAEFFGIPMTSLIQDALLCPYFIKYEVPGSAEDMQMELTRIGVNLNQLVKAMNEINLESKRHHDINLYVNNPQYAELAMTAANILNEFKNFSKEYIPRLNDMLRAMPKKEYYPDVKAMMDQDPDLKRQVMNQWQL